MLVPSSCRGGALPMVSLLRRRRLWWGPGPLFTCVWGFCGRPGLHFAHSSQFWSGPHPSLFRLSLCSQPQLSPHIWPLKLFGTQPPHKPVDTLLLIDGSYVAILSGSSLSGSAPNPSTSPCSSETDQGLLLKQLGADPATTGLWYQRAGPAQHPVQALLTTAPITYPI